MVRGSGTGVSLSLQLRLLASVGLGIAGLTLAGMCSGCGAGQGKEDSSNLSTARIRGSATSNLASQLFSGVTRSVHRIDRTQRNNFALLRGAPEPLPPSVRRVLRKPTYGMNWDLAQRVPLSLREPFWLIPGRHVLCLLHVDTAHEASSACAPTKTARAHGVVTISLREARASVPAERLIVGVVPDGTVEAVVHTGIIATRTSIAHHVFTISDSIEDPPDVVLLLN